MLLTSVAACQLYDGAALRVGESREPVLADAGAPDTCIESPYSACGLGCPEQCNGRDDDCDGRVDEAGADDSCQTEAAASICIEGRCEIVRCLDGARDCDGLAANGCEVSATDPNHCGTCGRSCELPHAATSCEAGSCGLDACEPGYADCDGRAANGCETSLRDDGNCGGCGVVCAEGSRCDGGACTGGTAEDCAQSPDCADLCPDDSEKRAPGRCGCGVPDTDSDGDGTLDCLDACPYGAWTAGPCLPFMPTNLDPTQLDFTNARPAVLNCGVTTLDTSTTVPVLSNSCGAAVGVSVQTQSDGSTLAVLTVRGLQIASGSTLRLVGTRPVAIAALGDVIVEGGIDVSAAGDVPGAGGNLACGVTSGLDGAGHNSLGGGGGGGGGFGTPGGAGGTGDGARAGTAGAALGGESLVPLRGGCGGGRGGGCTALTAGAGAVQLTAAGRVSVTGAIRANGGVGVRGCGSEGGGSGGGSGGAIFIEARAIEASPQALEANGGRGGDASGAGGIGSTAATLAGGNGQSHSANGGGGGGGGYGRIRTLLHQ